MGERREVVQRIKCKHSDQSTKQCDYEVKTILRVLEETR
jgi:hypothetical protein